MSVCILYRAKDFLVVHKPSGYVVYKDSPDSPPGALDFHQESVTGLALQWNFNLGQKKIKGEKKP